MIRFVLLLLFGYSSDLDCDSASLVLQVKIVRDSMNQMVKVWKDIPVAVVEDSNSASPLPDSNSKSSVRGETLVIRKSTFSSFFLSDFICFLY